MATAFTRRAGFASVFRARVAAVFALDVRFLAALFLTEVFLAEVFLEVLFFDALFLAALFLVVALFFRAVLVLRFPVLVARFLVLVARFLAGALRFDAERAPPALLRPVLRLVALLRPVDFRPPDFAREFLRDDFLVVAIHVLLVSR